MVLPLIGGLVGGLLNRGGQKKANQQADYYNRHKIRMTVEDAKAAGVHPLAALGSSVAGSWIAPQANTGIGDAVAHAGHAIGQMRQQKKQDTTQQLQNDLLKAQIRRTDAETADLVSTAQSRSNISRMRAAAIGGPQVLPGNPSVEETALFEKYHAGGGASTTQPRGMDPGEWLMGKIIQQQAVREMVKKMRYPHVEVTELPSTRPRYNPGKNKPPRGYYGPPGRRTGF